MALTLKTIVGIICFLGSFGAIGAPMVMNSISSSEVTEVKDVVKSDKEVAPVSVSGKHDDRGGQLDEPIEVEKCNSAAKISFGEKGEHDFCGKVKGLEDKLTEEAKVTDSLNQLFKKMWKKGDQNGNSTGGSSWKSSCLTGDKKGATTVESQATNEYLGYCGSKEEVGSESFLDVDKKVQEGRQDKKLDIKFCGDNCGSLENRESAEIQTLNNKNTENGKEVEFYELNRG